MTEFSADDGVDSRTWVDKMFVDISGGEKSPIPIVAHDCSLNPNLGSIDVIHNTISLLVDFAANTDSKHVLGGEHVLVLGGNRPARAGLGRIWVPVSQIPSFIEYMQNLKEYLDRELPGLVEQVKAER